MPDPHLGNGLVDEVKSPMYATCIGLVLKGFEDMTPTESSNTPKSKSKEKVVDGVKVKQDGFIKGFFGSFKNWMSDDHDDFK
jgi:cell division ATPase FtsA